MWGEGEAKVARARVMDYLQVWLPVKFQMRRPHKILPTLIPKQEEMPFSIKAVKREADVITSKKIVWK